VTSNKEVVASFGVELCEIAASHGVRYMFEASVGGGIPIIRPMMTDLASNKINSINGILNGTTNYILTAMRDDGKSFADALGEAQRLGYAEANPAADVEGKDAARKTVILGAIASGKLVSPEAISTEGITNISLCDVELAQTLGYSIKLIGHAEERDGKLLAFVSPMAVSESNPLARIDGVFNGILVNANMVGDVMFYGPGAGKLPTASAVVADIVDVIAKRDVPVTPVGWVSAEAEDIAPLDDYVCPRLVIVDGECDNALATLDGKSAYFTAPISETEARKINAAAIYRVL
jgi:homoserine dehydrogenase